MHGLFLWRDKKGIRIINAFQNNIDESEGLTYRHKPNKILVDEGNKSYNRSMKL